ncbi:MAG: NUDIX domain-containing protein [Eggerthellaceae bacterium]|nr:NUDIX domain-containing protein [Eggerthellaceae bacterium]
MSSIFEFEHPFITTDATVFSISTKASDSYRRLPDCSLNLLLYQRAEQPYYGKWCLPGGFLNIDEMPEDNICRKLFDKTHIAQCYLEQLYTFCDLERDPRARVISIVYLALLDELKMNQINEESRWFKLTPNTSSFTLAAKDGLVLSEEDFGFDHLAIIEKAFERLQSKILYSDIAFHLLPQEFTLTQMQHVYETILGKKEMAANFRRKIRDMVEETGRSTSEKGHRPAKLYIHKQDSDPEW